MNGWTAHVASAIKKMAAALGVDVRLHKHSPHRTWLGLDGVRWNTIIDVGANEGQFAKACAKRYPHARILSFEPLAHPFAQLNRLSKRVPQIEAHRLALGPSTRRTTMNRDPFSPTSSFLPRTAEHESLYPQAGLSVQETVQQTSLDKLVSTGRIRVAHPTLLKLDVQGYEIEVLKGATRILDQVDACLAEVSIAHLYEGQATFLELVELLDAKGLHFAGTLDQILRPDGRTSYLDAVFLKGKGSNHE